jgi:hypothetical protein
LHGRKYIKKQPRKNKQQQCHHRRMPEQKKILMGCVLSGVARVPKQPTASGVTWEMALLARPFWAAARLGLPARLGLAIATPAPPRVASIRSLYSSSIYAFRHQVGRGLASERRVSIVSCVLDVCVLSVRCNNISRMLHLL